MVTYWKRNSNPNLESMMLDTNADKINQFEYPEILECVSDLTDKAILELGAGIGFVRLFVCLFVVLICPFADVLHERSLHWPSPSLPLISWKVFWKKIDKTMSTLVTLNSCRKMPLNYSSNHKGTTDR
jgi:hypothetical protein